MSKEELTRRGLTRVVHTRKAAAGAAPGITTAKVFAKQNWRDEREGSKSLFNPPRANPTRQQRKNMVGLAMEVGIKATMQSHLYQLSGKVYLQSDGGPIGEELSELWPGW